MFVFPLFAGTAIRHVVRYFICFFVFYLNTSAVSAQSGSGALYFPVAWAISAESALNPAQFSEGTVTVQNTKTGVKISYPFETPRDLTQNGKRAVVFLGKKITALAPGNYDSIAFSAVYTKGSQGSRIALNDVYNINFVVADDKITVLGGVFIHSVINEKTKKITTPSLIKLHRFSLDYDDVSADVQTAGWIPRSSRGQNGIKDALDFSNQTSPLLVRQMPQTQNAQNFAHYGFLMKTSCPFNGPATIHFTHENDPVSYFKSVDVHSGKCVNSEQNQSPVHIFLSEGTWTVRNLSQLPTTDLKKFGFDDINHPILLNYYKTDSAKFLRNNSYSKAIDRGFSFTIQKDFASKFFYIGTFESQYRENNPTTLEASFERSFSLRDLRKAFKENRIYNGYTGDRIVHDKILGTVSILLRDVNVTDISKSDVLKLHKSFIAIISDCVHKIGEMNPLLVLDGSILLHSPNNSPLNENELKFVEKSKTVENFKKCLDLQLTSKNLPGFTPHYVLDAEISSL